MNSWKLILVLVFSLFCGCENKISKVDTDYDIVIIGAGTGAATAAIAASGFGVKTLLINPIAWLGGMLSSAGVSAIDGNHEMPAGIWGELRSELRDYYGGAKAMATGWVSHSQFEPRVADSLFKNKTLRIPSLEISYNSHWKTIKRNQEKWEISYQDEEGKSHFVTANILIDGTDLGDVAANVGVDFRLGMDSSEDSGESIAPKSSNDIIQDLTYVAILKDYGKNVNETIDEPLNYDPQEFNCSCIEYCDGDITDVHPCATMLSYAKLPNEKYLINWPREGNDYYVNDVLLDAEERSAAYQKAKDKTMRFIYFIQHELGYRNIGIADDEYPSADGLPLMPYHREGRRIKGKVFMTLPHITAPFDSDLYRTGIAVGDYPIDHHHLELPDAPEIDFPLIPSFNIPIGVLIPEDIPNIIIADKAMSVSNIVNGSSRLQPVIMQVGQAAGIIAALAIQTGTNTTELDVRKVQKEIIAQGGYLMPYWDVKPDHVYFDAIQKIGACGILKGIGEPYKWANRTWYYPDQKVDRQELIDGLLPFYETEFEFPKGLVSKEWMNALFSIDDSHMIWKSDKLNIKEDGIIRRGEAAFIINTLLNPFERRIDIRGTLE